MKLFSRKFVSAVIILSFLILHTNFTYAALETTEAPDADSITITNNAGISDTIYITNLYGGETIKVYNASSGGKLLKSVTVSATKMEVTISITQLGTKEGSVYISFTAKGELESSRIKAGYAAEVKSSSLNANNIIVTNNAGKSDIVSLTDLYGGETIRVYNAAVAGKLIGSTTVGLSKTEANITITQVGSNGGSIYVSVKNKGELESDRVEVSFEAEQRSVAPNAEDIFIVNNAGISDTISVKNVSTGDVIKIYNAKMGGTLLGYSSVSYGKTEASITITQLGKTGGSIFVTIATKGLLESNRVEVSFSAENKSSNIPAASITITNNATLSDTINITDLSAGDVIRVYDAEKGGNQIGTATVSSSASDATVTVEQLGTVSGSVYISVTGKGKYESGRTTVGYSGEVSSDSVSTNDIIVTNNSGKSDTVRVMNLAAADVVKVYDSASAGNLLGTATVGSSTAEATVTISQLGEEAGKIYVSVTSKAKAESLRYAVSYLAEPDSDVPDSYNIAVTNNPEGKADTIKAVSLTGGDTVKVYNSSTDGTLLGSATASSSATEVTISVTQLGGDAGSVYVSITSKYKNESSRIKVDYEAESQTDSASEDNITVINNVAGTADTVEVTDLEEADIVKVYNSASGGKLLGSATVPASSTYVTVSITQLGIKAGDVYVSITGANELESSRTKVSYSAESTSTSINSDNIAVTNNAGSDDIVEVMGLIEGDVVKVYDAAKGGSVLGTSTVGTYGTYTGVTISQLGTDAGSVYITITSTNKSESGRTKANYAAEPKSGNASGDNIIVTNNAEISDTVQVTGLSTNDLVKVYNALKGGNLLGSATVSSGTTANITIEQLGTAAGSIYISITGSDKLESDRVQADYSAEVQTETPEAGDISVKNNVGTADTVAVSGLKGGDIVNIYDAEKAGDLLGTATAGTYDTSVSISITQLGSLAGSVYVTVASKTKLESSRIKVDYSAEASSGTIDSSNITVTNNAGSSDTVQITGMNTDDIVYIYDALSGGNLLGSATVLSGTAVTVSIEQLGTTAGTIYVSVKGSKNLESGRTTVSYTAEVKNVSPDSDNISIINNVGTSDSIKVTGVSNGDIVNVYDAAKAGNLLGTATAGTYDTEITVPVTQLGSTAGSVYITVTSENKLESDRTQVDYTAEAQSTALLAENLTVVNNAGMSDAVSVTNLSGGETINVYDALKAGSLLGTATAGTFDSSVSISITQLGTSAGSIYATVTVKSKLESSRTKVDYTEEMKTTALTSDVIEIVNNAGISDTVKVTGLSGSETIKVYDSATGGTLLGSATASTYSSYITLTIDQLGTAAGSVYVTVAKKGYGESSRVRSDYLTESKSAATDSSNIVIQNNAGASDTVEINGLSGGDMVYVYSSATGGTLLGSATVGDYETYVTVTMTQLGTKAGNAYVSVKSEGKLESSRTEVPYAAEQTSDAPLSGNITITNNAGFADTIEVTYLEDGDYVKVYDAATSGNLLGTGTVDDGDTEATVEISQLGTSAGTVYISVTSDNKLESSRSAVTYLAETVTDDPDTSNIIVVNNANMADTVTVMFLDEGDTVHVYNTANGGKLFGSATVEEGETQAEVSISQLGEEAGNVYVSITGYGEQESGRTKVGYTAEQQSDPLSSSNVYVTNNAGMSDSVTVSYLDESDIIKIYSSSTGSTVLGSATVASGYSEVTIKISQLGEEAGTVYLTVTGYGKLESTRIAVLYTEEPTSDAPEEGNVTINNNSGKSDTVYVTGLTEGDIVKVYNAAYDGSLLGNATVQEDYTSVTIKISQLGIASGTVYISVTSPGAYESLRTAIDYNAE